MQYISLFHGRKDPNQDLEGWGEQGPIIGPINISWTYGDIKIHPANWQDDTFTSLPVVEHMVKLYGMYYGDFEILTAGDDILTEARKKNDRPILSYDQFVAMTKA